jgi:RNA polymerase sigma factor (sigma-70 family)
MTMRGTTLSRVIQSAADRGRAAVTDRDLLRRFADDGDQEAFEALVRRHTGLVLSVCRRALSNAQDAEDACQATFLLLARKAGAGRWQPSIANWLFATARRVARDVRRAADRRAKREGEAAVPESVVPVDQMSGRELLAVIDEELGRLPAIYREPLLLYYQAELARDEIAARLGLPAGTVKIRLERGRKKLGDGLTKRGVMLSAGLLTLMATSRAGASPSRLVEAIRAVAAGKVPPAVAALAEGGAVNGVIKKIGLGIILAVATAIVGLGIGEPRTTTAGPPPEKGMPAKAAGKEGKDHPADKADKVVMRTITGKVLDPDSKPVAGAEMINLRIDGSAEVMAKTGDDGTFKVTVPIKGPGSYLFPRVDGFATNEFLMPATNTPAEITYMLVKDAPIRGRIIDTQGKPVAGASVVVRHLAGFANESMDEFLAGWQKRPADGYGPEPKWNHSFRSWNDRTAPEGDSLFSARTDKDGRFVIAHLGRERRASLHVRGPGIAEVEVVVATRPGFDPTPYNRETIEKLKSSYSELGWHPMLYPPELNIVAEAEKPIRGVVREVTTGQPRAGAAVHMRESHTSRLPDLMATTDKDGRYEIHGAKKANKYELSVKRDATAGILGRTVKLVDTPAYAPITADIAVTKGIVLTGHVLDDATGKVLPGYACVGVLYDNGIAKTRPEFDSPDCYDFANTDKDGVYRTVVPPGPVLLMGGLYPDTAKGVRLSDYEQLKTDPAHPEYFEKRMSGFRSPDNVTTIMQGQWCKVLKLKPDQAQVTVDMRFKPASRFTVKIQDPDGKPLNGVTVAGNTARDWAPMETCETDACTVYELDAINPRVLAFFEPKRKLVGVLTLKGNEKEPATATLGPTGRIKGRLVNQAGEPLANVSVHLSFKPRAVGEIDNRIRGEARHGAKLVETNANGEFALDTVIPGQKFWVYGRRKEKYLEPPNWRNQEGKYIVAPGSDIDIGPVTVKEE